MKNSIFLIAGMLLISLMLPGRLFSQSFCGFTCEDCLNETFFSKTDIITITNLSYAATNIKDDFSDFQIKNAGCGVTDGCVFGTEAAANSLTYNVYYPNLTCDPYPRLPAVILFHGGGFSECSNKSAMEDYCIDFARRGFVAFSVEYRRGKDGANTSLTASYVLALYRGLQDARGAIRTIIKRQKEGAQPYKIDVNKIFIGGTSEGGVIAVHTAYLDQEEADELMPGASEVLGSLDNLAPMPRFYYGKPTISYTIRGVMNLWGALGEADDNGNAIDFIDAGEPPFIGFHGKLDPIVVYNLDSSTYSTGSDAIANQCDGIHYTNPAAGNVIWLAGSNALYESCVSKNICAEIYLDSDMEHGFSGNADPFGLSFTKPSKVTDYVVQRTASFFQAVLCGECSNIHTSFFLDCVNSRCKAATVDDMSDNYSCTEPRLMMADTTRHHWKIINSGNSIEVIFYDSSPATIDLYNISGQKVKNISGTFDHFEMNVSDLAQGIYLLRISTAEETRSECIHFAW